MKVFINAEQAMSVLPDGESIHTFIELGGCMAGADWSRADILDKVVKSDVLELAGPSARALGHGLCIYDKTAKMHSDLLFIETNEEKLEALNRELEEAQDHEVE